MLDFPSSEELVEVEEAISEMDSGWWPPPPRSVCFNLCRYIEDEERLVLIDVLGKERWDFYSSWISGQSVPEMTDEELDFVNFAIFMIAPSAYIQAYDEVPPVPRRESACKRYHQVSRELGIERRIRVIWKIRKANAPERSPLSERAYHAPKPRVERAPKEPKPVESPPVPNNVTPISRGSEIRLTRFSPDVGGSIEKWCRENADADGWVPFQRLPEGHQGPTIRSALESGIVIQNAGGFFLKDSAGASREWKGQVSKRSFRVPSVKIPAKNRPVATEDAKRCHHIAATGRRCKYERTKGNYCGKHQKEKRGGLDFGAMGKGSQRKLILGHLFECDECWAQFLAGEVPEHLRCQGSHPNGRRCGQYAHPGGFCKVHRPIPAKQQCQAHYGDKQCGKQRQRRSKYCPECEKRVTAKEQRIEERARKKAEEKAKRESERKAAREAAKLQREAERDAIRCAHTTPKGYRCAGDKIDDSEFCQTHHDKIAAKKAAEHEKLMREAERENVRRSRQEEQNRSRCSYTTGNGRCTNTKLEGSEFCQTHHDRPKASTTVPDHERCCKIRPGGGRCGNRRNGWSAYCLDCQKREKEREQREKERDAKRCSFTGPKGNRCRGDKIDGSDFCQTHHNRAEAKKEVECRSRKTGRVSVAKPVREVEGECRFVYERTGRKCTFNAHKDTGYCTLHERYSKDEPAKSQAERCHGKRTRGRCTKKKQVGNYCFGCDAKNNQN